MVQMIIYGSLALGGVLSFFFGLIGVGVMTIFWRIMHVLIGLVMMAAALPFIMELISPRRK